MIFGIYAGSIAGTETGMATGKQDDPVSISEALSQLHNKDKVFLVRGYIQYLGGGRLDHEAPMNVEQYVAQNRKLNLVICYRARSFDEKDWSETIRKVITRYRDSLYSIQITEEPNLKVAFAGDGCFENIEEALRTGIIAARKEIKSLRLPVRIGFNAVPSFNPADNFWNVIGSSEFGEFREAIDYVGLDFYPDVFRPVAADGEPNDLKQSVKNVLGYFRNVNLKTGNIPLSIPIHITENGWPTGEGKTYKRQANVIEKVIRTIYEIKNELNIQEYDLFGLRDADSSNADIFYQFGLLKDDYSPKPAFHIYRKLINELS